MPIDPSRAAFVSQEYRYATVRNDAIKDDFANATEIVIDTNLDLTAATTLATDLANATDDFSRVFEVTIAGILDFDDFDGSLPSYIPDFPQYGTNGSTYRLIGAEIDYVTDRTMLRIRG